MTDDELDLMVRRSARPVIDSAPSDLDPGLLDAILAETDAVTALRPRRAPVRALWTMLATAAAVLLVLTLTAMPGGWRERLVDPAGSSVQRYLLPEPWQVSGMGLFDADRLDVGVVGRSVFDNDEDESGFASLDWASADRFHAEHLDRASALTQGVGVPRSVEGRDYEVFLRLVQPRTLGGEVADVSAVAAGGTAVWVDGSMSYLLSVSDVDEQGLLDLLAALEPVPEQLWLDALPGGRIPPANGVSGFPLPPPDGASVAEVLAGVPLPPELDLENAYRLEGVQDRELLVTPAFQGVACGWLREWATATAVEDRARAAEASQALSSLAEQSVLQEVGADQLSEQVARYARLARQDGADPDAVLAAAGDDLCPRPPG